MLTVVWSYKLHPDTNPDEFRDTARDWARALAAAPGLLRASVEEIPTLGEQQESDIDFVATEVWRTEAEHQTWWKSLTIAGHSAPVVKRWAAKRQLLRRMAQESFATSHLIEDVGPLAELTSHQPTSERTNKMDLTAMDRLHALKERVIQASREASRLGLVPATHGNFSARDPESGLIVITPTQRPYSSLEVEDIDVVDIEGNQLDGRYKPSSETLVHCRAYEMHPEVHGVAHTEPRFVNCFGLLGKEIPPILTTLYLNIGGGVPVAPFMVSGSREFADAVLEVMGNVHGVIWGNHGLMTIGPSIESAVERAEIIEHSAASYYYALLLGKPSHFPLETLQHLL